MAIKFPKPQTAAAPAQTPEQKQAAIESLNQQDHLGAHADTSTLDGKVARMIELQAQIPAAKAVIDEFDALKKALQLVADEQFQPSEEATLQGDTGSILYTPKVDSTEIVNKNALIGFIKEKLGYPKLVELIGFTQTGLKKYFSDAELAPYLNTEKNVGARKLKAVVPNK